jgi:hypothetical protein
VDDWGKFKWLLLRLRGRSGRQALLVRGANYASDAQLMEQTHRQVCVCVVGWLVCGQLVVLLVRAVMVLAGPCVLRRAAEAFARWSWMC